MNDNFQQHIDKKYLSQLASTFSQPTAVEITMNTLDLFYYISYLQFTHRGAEEDEKTQSKIKEFTNRLVAILTTVHPELEEIIATGWNPAYDIRSDTKEFNDPNAAIAAEIINQFEQEQGLQTEPSLTKPHKIVHNLWTLYAAEADGSLAENLMMCFGTRPQDWGHPRWSYEHYTYTRTFEDEIITSVCHTWTDWPELENQKRAEIFAKVMTQINLPGCDPHLCSRSFLGEDDFWSKEWGPPPPYYEDPEKENDWYFDDYDSPEPVWHPGDDSDNDTAGFPYMALDPEDVYGQAEPADDLDKPYYELKLVAFPADGGLVFVLAAELTPAEYQDYAEINIPHITADAVYDYTIFAYGVQAGEPALTETVIFKGMIDEIHKRFNKYAERKNQ